MKCPVCDRELLKSINHYYHTEKQLPNIASHKIIVSHNQFDIFFDKGPNLFGDLKVDSDGNKYVRYFGSLFEFLENIYLPINDLFDLSNQDFKKMYLKFQTWKLLQ